MCIRDSLKITPRGKSGGDLGLGELPKKIGFPIIFLQWGLRLQIWPAAGFAKTHHKFKCRKKGGHGPGLGELPKIWGFPFNIYTMGNLATLNLVRSLGLPGPIIKSCPEENMGITLG